jgi:hypothetical protein
MRLRVLEADLFLTDCTTRLPFRFGVSTLTFAPLATARIRVETEGGGRGDGFSSDLLVPRWFEKDLDKTPRDDVENLLASARRAAEHLTARDRGMATAFDHWWDLHRLLVAPRPADAPDGLVHGFGVALMERAMIDAVCRAAGATFHDVLRNGRLGFDPARVDGSLAGWDVARALPARPADTIHVRHTVGMLDALREADRPAAERLDDGLPETLEACIRRYGLTHFKIKLGGDADADLERLRAVADVLAETVAGPARVTFDANEQFDDLADLADLLDRVRADPAGPPLLQRLLLIEQPLARARTFDAAPNAAMPRVEAYAPVMIDEADATDDAFPRAIALGYRGVSVKSCKGVFRALVNRGRCDRDPAARLFQSAEDLTNLPVLALQQDLATHAALGLEHVERNGHHFFRGLDHVPRAEAKDALAAHPDLYRRDPGPGDRIALRIEAGRLALGSVTGSGYGGVVPIRCEDRTPADAWRWPETT